MAGQLVSIAFLVVLCIVKGQHSSSLCQTTSGNPDGCHLHLISDKLEQISAKIDKKTDNVVQHISEQIQCNAGQSHSNLDFSCPESPDNAANDASLPENCHDVYNMGHHTGGIYTVYEPLAISPFRSNRRSIKVFCDMAEANGGPGWMIFQRRQDGSVSFNRTWAEYRSGFGDVAGEHWLGNDNLAIITSASTTYELRIDMEDWEGEQRYARYSSFTVQPEVLRYKLSLGGYTGDVQDSMTYHHDMYFSTHDMDNDQHSTHCAQVYSTGWWYNGCVYTGLNNPYYSSSRTEVAQGIFWNGWHGHSYSLKQVQMKLRPLVG